MYVWPRVRRFYVKFLGRASGEDLSRAPVRSAPVRPCSSVEPVLLRVRVCVPARASERAWTAAPASLVNLINPTDISGTDADAAPTVLRPFRRRAFHDNAAPARMRPRGVTLGPTKLRARTDGDDVVATLYAPGISRRPRERELADTSGR